MKKLTLFSFLIFSSLISCSDEDSSDNNNNTEISSDIVGKWRLDYYTPYEEDGTTYSIEDCEKESIYTYNEDGTGSYEYVLTIDDNGTCAVDGSGTFNYSIEGNTLTQDEEVVTFIIVDDTLTITYDNGEVDQYIKTTDALFSEQ